MSSEISRRRARQLERFATATAIIAIVTGVAVLIGWSTGGPPWTRGALLSGVTMKANTSIGLALTGIALFIRLRWPADHGWRITGNALATFVALLGGISLLEHIFSVDFGIDQLLFVEPPNELGTASPGLMGPPAALSFLLLGAALILIRGGARAVLAAQYAASLAIVISIPGILGHLYGVERLYALSRVTGVALPTGVTLVILGLGLMATRPDIGLTRLFVAEDAGGAVLRRLIVPATAFFIVLGWIAAVAQSRGLVDAELGAALHVVVLIVFLAALGIDNANAMNAVARSRDRAERERERLLESERAARTEAERAARSKDDFLATISHELRTPLSGILGWTHVLQRTDDPATRDQAIEAIERGARAQAKLIEDLLDVSSVVSGKVRLDVRTVNIPETIESAIGTLSPAAEAKSIQIQRVVDSQAGPVKGDASRLQQVFWNLISNAIKFTPKGGTIQVHVERAESSVQITVSDNGSGIAPEFLPHVFDRFRQEDSSPARRHGGLGLGLSIVKHIVDLHGGSVAARSDGIGFGSSFIVRLPIAIAKSPATTGQSDALPESPVSLRDVRVLLVDDDPDSVESVRRLLLDYSAVVDVAHSARDALQRAERFNPHVIVADIGMPEMDGYNFVEHLRARERGQKKRTPAIALTAFSRPADRIRALEAGFNFHLAKPVEPRELVAVIGSLSTAENRTPKASQAVGD